MHIITGPAGIVLSTITLTVIRVRILLGFSSVLRTENKLIAYVRTMQSCQMLVRPTSVGIYPLVKIASFGQFFKTSTDYSLYPCDSTREIE